MACPWCVTLDAGLACRVDLGGQCPTYPTSADRQLISHLTPGCTCDHRPGDPCNASCPVHLGAGLRRA